MIPIKILLVEDSPTQAAFSKHELQAIGPQVTVEVARSATEGRRLISTLSNKLDLVILDLILPDGTGLDMCKELKTGAATKQVPVVIFSMEGLSKHRREAYESGADHYISKGGTGDTTLRLVASTLLRNKLRKLPRLGEGLIERGYLNIDQLQRALNNQKSPHLLGQVLIEMGYINQAQLDEVLELQKRTPE
jgi:DNA-binding response OmpR family regulator